MPAAREITRRPGERLYFSTPVGKGEGANVPLPAKRGRVGEGVSGLGDSPPLLGEGRVRA